MNPLERQTDKILDTLLSYLNGDINDRYLAKKQLDEQRKVWNRIQSTKDEKCKRTLSELCEIPIFHDFKGFLEDHNGPNTPPEKGVADDPSTKTSMQSNRPIGNCTEILDYLKKCRNQTASVTDLETYVSFTTTNDAVSRVQTPPSIQFINSINKTVHLTIS